MDDIDGRHPDEPWTKSDLDRVMDAMRGLATSLTPSPVTTEETAAAAFHDKISGWRLAQARGEDRLDKWFIRNLSRLANLEAQAPEAAEGETLVNFDVRADNLLLTEDRVYVLDWPWARTGARWLDVACMAPSITMQGGPPPETVLQEFGVRGVSRQAIDAVVCALAGYFVVEALNPPPQGLPTLRAFQAAQGQVAAAWLHKRTGWR